MAYDSAHVLLTWGGKLPGGESWTCGIRLCEQLHVPGSETVPPQAEVRSWLNSSLADAVQAYHTRPGTCIHQAAKLSFAKAARVGTDGRYMDQSTDEHVFTDLAGGGNTSLQQPPQQIALAISLTTGYTRGPAHRGRFYLPMPIIYPGAEGLIDPNDAQGIAGSTRTFLEALADVPGIDAPNSLTPCVMSQRGGGAHRVITGVEVGRVLDTQRRRRRGLKELYRTQTLDLGAH
jgi:hypothetical protein